MEKKGQILYKKKKPKGIKGYQVWVNLLADFFFFLEKYFCSISLFLVYSFCIIFEASYFRTAVVCLSEQLPFFILFCYMLLLSLFLFLKPWFG